MKCMDQAIRGSQTLDNRLEIGVVLMPSIFRNIQTIPPSRRD